MGFLMPKSIQKVPHARRIWQKSAAPAHAMACVTGPAPTALERHVVPLHVLVLKQVGSDGNEILL